jgi:hypothetical protein
MTSDRRLALAREWDDLVARARAVPGLGDFLRPPSPETLLPAARQGPVVILNVSRWRCDALVVRAGGVDSLPLPALDAEIVAERAESYLAAVGGEQVDERALDECLRWMWDAFAGAVLRHLGHLAPPAPGRSWPRVWWCPTGALALLPLHAAGHHDRAGESVIDRVVSSYTPTLRALLDARAAGPARTPERMLFVGVADAPGEVRLSNVDREERILRTLLAGDGHVFLTGRSATRARMLDQLADHGWVHFSGHARQDLDNPSRGGLVLRDGMVTVTDFGVRAYRGEFAFLAGCETAVGGRALPDEAITLAAALHHAGYRHVVATLWTVGDLPVSRLVEELYRGLLPEGRPSAEAAAAVLHRSVHKLRARYPRSPSAWAPYAHTGP